jgi:hypothetical protein
MSEVTAIIDLTVLSNREIATLLIAVCVLIGALFVPGVRKSLRDIVRLVFGKHILPMILIYLAYAAGVIALAMWAGIWGLDLLKDTAVMVLFVGLPLLFKSASVKDGVMLIRHTFTETLGVSVLVLFYVNLASLPIIAEIVVQLLAIVATLMAALSAIQLDKYRSVARLMTGLLVVIGIGLMVYTTVSLIVTWDEQDIGLILRTLALSIWYPFALLPLIYGAGFYSRVESLMVMLPFFNDRKLLPRRVRFGILVGLRGSVGYAANFTGQWRMEAGKLRTYGQTRTLMAKYRADAREKNPRNR